MSCHGGAVIVRVSQEINQLIDRVANVNMMRTYWYLVSEFVFIVLKKEQSSVFLVQGIGFVQSLLALVDLLVSVSNQKANPVQKFRRTCT